MPDQRSWTAAEKAAFRFFFPFFGLYIIIFNNSAFSFADGLLQYLLKPLHSIVPWIAAHVLKLEKPITIFTNGSGDTTYDYVCLLLVFALAVFIAIVWTIIDRRNTGYDRLYYWLTVGMRYYVGLMLINYGFYKVFKAQFSSPGFYRLNETYGDSSPMGLAWTFLGFSDGYNYFMGFAELLGALLLFRRTYTIGAFLALLTCANIMAVNYFFDVPVKIVSTGLVTMCLYLLVPNIKPLWHLFFQAKTVQLRRISAPAIHKTWLLWTLRSVKFLAVFFVLASSANGAYYVMTHFGEHAKKPPFYGSYDVKLFSPAKITQADSLVWRKLIVETDDYVTIKFGDDRMLACPLKIDQKKQTFRVSDSKGNVLFDGTFAETISGNLKLEGHFAGDRVSMHLYRKGRADFTLTGRGFHWISEYPYNR